MGISFNAASLLNGNGIDVNSLVSQVQAQEGGQVTVWQQEQTTLQTQATDLGTLNTDLTNLQTAVNALTDPLGALTAVAANSSMPAILTATADSTAASANHTIVVTNLASVGTVYTTAVAGGANASILPTGATGGDLTLQIGGSSGTTEDIPITAGSNDTVSTLANYINQQSTQNNWGVTASVLTDATGARLAITSSATGTPGALAITSNTTTGSSGTNPPTNLTFTAVGGANAALTIDGIGFSSTSNAVSGAIPGVTLNLVSAEPTVPLQLSVGPDTDQATTAINAFVVAYNTLMTAINQQFTVNASTNTEGPLGSDGSLRSLQSSLMADVSFSFSDSSVPGKAGFANLASLGISTNDDGTLTVGNTANNQSLSDLATANPTAFLAFFQNSSSTGFANNFSTDLTNLTDPTNGILNLDLAQNSTQQTDLTTQISNFQDQMATQKQQLIAEFSQVNAALEDYPYVVAELNAALGNPYTPSTSNSTPTAGSSTASTTSSSDSTS